MKDKEIRQEVRRILRETPQQLKPAYSINGGDNKFPHEGIDDIVRLPEDINTKEDYLINWEGVSSNQDLYGFPMEEFKKGIQVEKAKNDMFNILDISKIVINNLKDNPQFYTNLGVK